MKTIMGWIDKIVSSLAGARSTRTRAVALTAGLA